MIWKATKHLLKSQPCRVEKIYKTVENFRMTGSLLDNSEIRKLVFFVDKPWFLLGLDLNIQNKVIGLKHTE